MWDFPPKLIGEIEIGVRVATTPERAWAAWTDPARLVDWFPDRASGSAEPGATMSYEWEALQMGLELEVLDATPERELVLRGQPPGLAPQTQTIRIAPNAGGVTVALRHTGFDDDDIRDGTESGWRVALQIMKLYLERYYERPRTTGWILGLAPATLPRVFEHYASSAGLAQWLGRGDAIGDAGSDYALDLLDGGAMTGEVLARCEPRDVALRWSEIDGVAALRVFRVAPGAALVGVNVMSWGRPDAELEPVARGLQDAVNRLVVTLGGTSATA